MKLYVLGMTYYNDELMAAISVCTGTVPTRLVNYQSRIRKEGHGTIVISGELWLLMASEGTRVILFSCDATGDPAMLQLIVPYPCLHGELQLNQKGQKQKKSMNVGKELVGGEEALKEVGGRENNQNEVCVCVSAWLACFQ